MVTLVVICGDPHYTSYTDQSNFLWKCEVSVGVCWGEHDVGRKCNRSGL